MASLKSGAMVSPESIKVIAESVGTSNLQDEPAKVLAEDVTYRIKLLLQDATKFMRHGKRKRLTTFDIDYALKVRNIEPMYGSIFPESLPSRFASGGGRELFFVEDKELDINDLLNSQMPKYPRDITVRAHWLSVEGTQTALPENPPVASKEATKSDDPTSKLLKNGSVLNKGGKAVERSKHIETVNIKAFATHELSMEQQLYFKEITEACVGADEQKRTESLQSLSTDPGLHQMLPSLCMFIYEGVKVNVVQNNLALLIYLMRMVKALLDNQTLFLERYLHELLPSVVTCIVSKQLCLRPDVDNHWALRDFASRLMGQINKNFSTPTNNLQNRIVRILGKHFTTDKAPLSSHYGVIAGLAELGVDMVKTYIVPRVKVEGERIRQCLEGPGIGINMDKIAAEHIKQLIHKVVPPVLKTMKTPPDNMDEYRNEFGYLGPALYAAVLKLRQSSGSILATVPAQNKPVTVGTLQPRLVAAPSVVRSQTILNVTRPAIQTNVAAAAASGQKYVFLTPGSAQRPQSAATAGATSIVKVVSSNPTQNFSALSKVGNTIPMSQVLMVPVSQGNLGNQQ